ncbi:hypothetical protein N7447_009853 [Penicillium robsamsonii]|uniref:uncharacterized protein n=1 Tax=Penicillium robsamsonii TaxID=1792511 RepID=UPI002546FDDA|nr:uncharacterized protein N7447_009853 [Penicillium robsamsonii]KAJ5812830.1 hypothetical protein N7447_009853 [Penicillium robsamsonii]
MAPQAIYYAVYKGRVDKPAIYCSWSQAHPRVIGCKGAEHDKLTLEDACNEMFQRGIKDFDMPIKNSVKRDTIPLNKGKHWAVAGGRATGVFTDWKSAEKAITGTNACHGAFSSQEEAEDFIASWKDAFADVSRLAIRQALENGWVPRNMKFNVESFLIRDNENMMGENDKEMKMRGIEKEEYLDLLNVEKLTIKEEQ